ncbi:MAG: type II toxin-antitoxin system VapC family toxin [Aestuariibacter sp.]|nr:type II toxin-antitoxin system VapC family toxin [Aestuariibacter sp.]
MTYVVDASVAMKWFVPEELSQEALTYLKDEHELLTPDLLWPEFANIAWKKVRRVEEARHVLSSGVNHRSALHFSNASEIVPFLAVNEA